MNIVFDYGLDILYFAEGTNEYHCIFAAQFLKYLMPVESVDDKTLILIEW